MLEAYQRIHRISVLVISIILLAIFAYSLASFYTSAPSPGFSREVELAELSPATIYSYDRPTAVVSSSDGKSATIIVGENEGLLLIRTDETGTILSRNNLDVNINSSPHVTGYLDKNGDLVILHGNRTLERVLINPETLEYTEESIATDIRSFEGTGPRIAYTKADGLYLWSDIERKHVGPLVSGTVSRVSTDEDDESTLVAAVVSRGVDNYDLEYFRFDDNLEVFERKTLLNMNGDGYYRSLRGIKGRGSSVSMLFLFRDNQFGLNFITIRRFDRETGATLDEKRTGVPIINCNYSLLEESMSDTESFLMRYRTIYGDNLVRCDLSGESDAKITSLTKTRRLSVESSFLRINETETLIFTDYSKENRRILLASNNPEIVRKTTRWVRGGWGGILGTTLAHFVVSLFAMWIYLLIAASPSLIFTTIAQRFLRPRLLNTYILVAIGAVGYTVLKLFVTSYFLGNLNPQHVLIPWVGTGVGLSLVEVSLSILSYGLVTFSFAPIFRRNGSISGVFLRFAVIDGIFYSASFLIYGVTAMLIRHM